MILDLRLPDVPGEEVAREVRGFSSVPILMLTAKASEEDRIHGLELGADDYLSKPFSPRELVLRAQAILRRTRGDDAEGALSYGGGRLAVDEARREVAVDGSSVALTPTEFGILVALTRVAGARLLPLRADQPRPRLRVRGLRADDRLARQEPAPEDRATPTARRRSCSPSSPAATGWGSSVTRERPRPGGLRLRLLLAFVGVAAVAIGAFAALTLWSSRGSVSDLVHRQQRATMRDTVQRARRRVHDRGLVGRRRPARRPASSSSPATRSSRCATRRARSCSRRRAGWARARRPRHGRPRTRSRRRTARRPSCRSRRAASASAPRASASPSTRSRRPSASSATRSRGRRSSGSRRRSRSRSSSGSPS